MGKKLFFALLKGISVLGIIGVALLSESVISTPKPSETGFILTKSNDQKPGFLPDQNTIIAQNSSNSEADRLLQEGDQLFQQGTAESLRAALEKLEAARQLYRAAGDRGREATTLASIGAVYHSLGEKQKALDYYNQALPLLRAVRDRRLDVYSELEELEENEKALKIYQQTLTLYEELRDHQGAAEALEYIGNIYFKKKQYDQIEKIFSQKLDSYKRYSNFDFTKSIIDLLRKKLANSWRFQAAIGVIGERFGSINLSWQEQLQLSKLNLFISKEVNDIRWEGHSLHGLGWVYRNMGFYYDSLKAYQLALEIAQKRNAQAHQIFLLTEIGGVYNDLGEYDLALQFLTQSLDLIPNAKSDDNLIPFLSLESFTLNQIGRSYLQKKQYEKALYYFEKALLKETFEKKHIFNNIGIIYFSKGEYDRAIAAYKEALKYRNTGDHGASGLVLNNMGLAYVEKYDYARAEEAYQEALRLFLNLKDEPGKAITLYNIAVLEYKQGNLREALTKIERSIAIVEEIRARISSRQLRQSYFATVQDYYEFYIDLLMQLHQQNPNKGYDAQALHISERARARSLLELLTEATANIRQGADPKLLEQERNLQQQLNALENRRYQLQSGQYNEQELNEIKQKIDNVLAQLKQLEAQIRTTSPRYAALKYPEPLNLQQIQQQILDDDTLLLEYSLGEERSYLWAVTKNSITSYVLPKQSEIEAAVKTFRDSVTKDSSATLDTGLPLSQILLAPVANLLSNKRLLIVGDGALQYVPFAALPTPTSPPAPLLRGEGSNSSPPFPRREGGSGGLGLVPLLVQNEIVTLPSISTVAIQRRQVQNRTPVAKTVAVIADPIFNREDDRIPGNPPAPTRDTLSDLSLNRATRNLGLGQDGSGKIFDRLPFTRTEANKILALVPEAERLQAFDFNASRETATNPDLSQYQIIHFATHGLVDPIAPELSGMVLSLYDQKGNPEDGFLRLNDIFNLNLPAELVVLSACETGLGENVKGEGLVGLTRGFMYAGARRVVVSLWSVNDAATSELMAKFYQKMLQGGENPIQALREAQLEMWNSSNRKSPYYWAAFTVQGDWR